MCSCAKQLLNIQSKADQTINCFSLVVSLWTSLFKHDQWK